LKIEKKGVKSDDVQKDFFLGSDCGFARFDNYRLRAKGQQRSDGRKLAKKRRRTGSAEILTQMAATSEHGIL
jgi:hypothetical protein